MSGSIYGTHFTVTTWGESHGAGIGAVVDGCPAGLPLAEDDIQIYLNRRKPGQTRYSTPRKENDTVEILSGVFEGYTTGAPISLLVRNTNQHSGDYGNIRDCYRPGHADFTFDSKYGFRDYRGGGRSSGRETIGRVAAGAIACRILGELGITVQAYTKAIGPHCISDSSYHMEEIDQNPFCMPDNETAKKAEEYLDACMKSQDSAGGIIECRILGCPPGIGEPVFGKLDARLAQAILSIGAVKGIEFGDGFAAASQNGSTNNDAFCLDADGQTVKKTNHAGGILGGMSDGSPILFRAAVKPTPSISREQHTVTRTHEETSITIHGRHDPVIVPRAVVVVESMAAITLTDLLFANAVSRMDRLKKLYT